MTMGHECLANEGHKEGIEQRSVGHKYHGRQELGEGCLAKGDRAFPKAAILATSSGEGGKHWEEGFQQRARTSPATTSCKDGGGWEEGKGGS